MNQNLHPLHQYMLMQQTGMPTPGRRAMGFGASPFGPGGPLPIHQMNWLVGGMGRHGMLRTPFGAGQYPNPQLPFPLGLQAMPMMGGGGGGMGGGGFGGGGMGGFGGDMGLDILAGGLSNPLVGMGMSGGMGGGMGGLNPWLLNDSTSLGMGGMGLLPSYDDDDESSIWDSDEDAEGLPPYDALFRSMQKRKRKQGCGIDFDFQLPWGFYFGRDPDTSWKKTWGW